MRGSTCWCAPIGRRRSATPRRSASSARIDDLRARGGAGRRGGWADAGAGPGVDRLSGGSAMFDAVARQRLRSAAAVDRRTRGSRAAGRAQQRGHPPPRPGGAGRGDRRAGRGGGERRRGGARRTSSIQNALEIEYAAMNARYGAARGARLPLPRGAGEAGGAQRDDRRVLRAGAAAITGYSNAAANRARTQPISDRYNAFSPAGSGCRCRRRGAELLGYGEGGADGAAAELLRRARRRSAAADADQHRRAAAAEGADALAARDRAAASAGRPTTRARKRPSQVARIARARAAARHRRHRRQRSPTGRATQVDLIAARASAAGRAGL
jgi:hypothetical protein